MRLARRPAARTGLTMFALALAAAFLVATRPTALTRAAAIDTVAPRDDVADLSRQAQLDPHFAMVPRIHAMLPAQVRARGSIRIAMSIGIAPINFPGDTPEEVKGLMPDLAAGLQQILGIRFEPAVYPSTASQLLAIDSGRVQLAVSTNSDTPERERTYDFINYLVAENSLVMQAGDEKRLRDKTQLCGQPFGEVKGAVSLLPTFEEMCRRHHRPAPVLASFDDAPSMMLALASRRILCFVGSPFNTIYLRSQGVAVTDVLLPEAGQKFLGLTVSKRDPAITAAVQAAMEELVANGYYRRAFERWGLGRYAITPRVNLAPAEQVPTPPPPSSDQPTPTPSALPRPVKGLV